MNDIIRKARTKYDMLFTLTITVIGIITCIIATSGTIVIMGVTFIIAGIICWFLFKSGYEDVSTKKKLSKTEVYYAVEHKNNVLDAVMNAPQRLVEFPRSPMNSIKLDIYYNEDDSYMRMYEYIPCNYKPCTKLIRHNTSELSNLLH